MRTRGRDEVAAARSERGRSELAQGRLDPTAKAADGRSEAAASSRAGRLDARRRRGGTAGARPQRAARKAA